MDAEPLSLEHRWWGEVVRGTKQQLQALELGDESPYPGEEGAPAYAMKVTDPRGFKTEIRRDWDGNELFVAYIHYPQRKIPYAPWTPFAPGVKKQEPWRHDAYVGTAAALEAAGLLRRAWLPGLPGMPKVRVTVLQDGSFLPPGKRRSPPPGSRVIQKVGNDRYRVEFRLPEEAANERCERIEEARERLIAEFKALPLPAPLPGLRQATNRRAQGARTEEEFRNKVSNAVTPWVERCQDVLCASFGGFRFAPDEEDRDALANALRTILDYVRCAEVISKNPGQGSPQTSAAQKSFPKTRDRDRLKTDQTGRQAAEARANGPLQAFLAVVEAKAKKGGVR